MGEEKNSEKPKRVLNTCALTMNGITYHDDHFRAGNINKYLISQYPQAALVTEGLLEWEYILSPSSLVSTAISQIFAI